jgi:nucleoside-diphosphate-sugar epimerase
MKEAPMTALITGGTGMLGRSLAANLQDSVVLGRDRARAGRKRCGRAVRRGPQAGPASREALDRKPEFIVAASVVGSCGDRGDTVLDGALAAVTAAPERTAA